MSGFTKLVRNRRPLARAKRLFLERLEDRSLLATIDVTGTGDSIAVDGVVTLREAIRSANNNVNINADVVAVGAYGADTINVPAGTYTLAIAGQNEDAALTGDLDITDRLTINGAGRATTIIQAGTLGGPNGNGIDRVFHAFDRVEAPPTDVNISGVTIRHGLTEDEGGGIFYDSIGTLTITNSTIANNTSGIQGGGIQMDAPGTVNITDSTLTGNLADDEGGAFQIDAGNMNITRCTVTSNHSNREGGAIESESDEPIVIIDSTFTGNSAPEDGGAIDNDADGDLTITRSTITGNSTFELGGAITNDGDGTLTITESTISGNSADLGGGIQNEGDGTVNVIRSTISGNTATSEGGGIWNQDGTINVTNSTISGNSAAPGEGGEGGGIYQGNGSGRVHISLVNVTIFDNDAEDGGGIFNDGTGTITLLNTIVASSTGGNCSGELIVSQGHNLEDADDCGFGSDGDLVDTNPLLGPLANNGGPTDTHALLVGSPAIDTADPLEFPPTDQRGIDRPQGNGPDIGAFEAPPAGALECEVITLNSPGRPGTARIEEDDPDHPGATVLIVTGTSGKDVIVVEPQPKSEGIARVVQNDRVIVTFISTDVRQIVIFGLDGNDSIVVSSALFQPATIFGGRGKDVIVGGSGPDQIDGGDGKDVIDGLLGDDVLCGGNGNDVVDGNLGNDLVGGDAGNDVLVGNVGTDLLLGGDGRDVLDGGVGNDHLFGQAGNDTLIGGVGNNILVGGDGNDLLVARFGFNILIGGAGFDTIIGNGLDDILVAGSTAHDENDAALQAILDEWTSGNTYDKRVSNIRNGGGANGGFVLDDTTVFDDGVKDTLYGNPGRDWFWIGVKDKLKDRKRNEQVN